MRSVAMARRMAAEIVCSTGPKAAASSRKRSANSWTCLPGFEHHVAAHEQIDAMLRDPMFVLIDRPAGRDPPTGVHVAGEAVAWRDRRGIHVRSVARRAACAGERTVRPPSTRQTAPVT